MLTLWTLSPGISECSVLKIIYATADEAVAYMFYRCFLFFFCFFLLFPSAKNMRQPFSGTAERISMKLAPNDTGENGVCNVLPPPGEWLKISLCWFMLVLYCTIPDKMEFWSWTLCRRLANVVPPPGEWLGISLCWFGIVRPQRLRYKIMSARMHLV